MYKLERTPVPSQDCIPNQLINKLSVFRVIAIGLLFVNETIHRTVLGVLTHRLIKEKKNKKIKTKKHELKFNVKLKPNKSKLV